MNFIIKNLNSHTRFLFNIVFCIHIYFFIFGDPILFFCLLSLVSQVFRHSQVLYCKIDDTSIIHRMSRRKARIHDTCRTVERKRERESLDFHRYPFSLVAFPAGNIDRNYVRNLTYSKTES